MDRNSQTIEGEQSPLNPKVNNNNFNFRLTGDQVVPLKTVCASQRQAKNV